MIKKWKIIVNDFVMVGRDSHLLAEYIKLSSPVQILLGMYKYKGNRTITIPQFLHETEEWMEFDDEMAEVELAICVTDTIPANYYIFKENQDSWNAEYYMQSQEAKKQLIEWADRIIS